MTRPALCRHVADSGRECYGLANASGYCPMHDPAARERYLRAYVGSKPVLRSKAEAARDRERYRRALAQ